MTLAALIDRLHRQAQALERSGKSPDPEARVWLVASDLRALAHQLDRGHLATLAADLATLDDEAA